MKHKQQKNSHEVIDNRNEQYIRVYYSQEEDNYDEVIRQARQCYGDSLPLVAVPVGIKWVDA